VTAPGPHAAQHLLVAVATPRRVEVLRLAPGEDAALRARLAGACVGLRVVVSGAAAEVARVVVLLRELGLEDDEVVALPDAGGARVWCAHCKAITDAPHADRAVCRGCGVVLAVDAHVSPRLGAHLGVAAP
jgi:dimethylamine monooxygenase subunit C